MKIQTNYLALFVAICLAVSCGFGRGGSKQVDNNSQSHPLSDLFEVVDTLSGWTLSSSIKAPAICLKIKNNSGQTITEPMSFSYKFIYIDEIIDSGNYSIDASAGWDDGLVKRIIIHEKERKLWLTSGLSVEVKFSDGTIAYSGPIENNDIYPDGNWYNQKHGAEILRNTGGLDGSEPIQKSESPIAEPKLDPRAAFPGLNNSGDVEVPSCD